MRSGEGSDGAAVRRLVRSDRKVATATAARAFTIDPMFDHFTRDRLHAHRILPRLLAGVVDDLVAHGDCWVADSSDGVVGIAGWSAPGTMPRGTARDAAIAARSALGALRVVHRAAGMRLLAQVEKHHPAEPHWYLGLLTVDPTWQGRGLGGRLIGPGLDRADDDGLPAYLETQKESNLSWYGRHGFEVTRTIEVRGVPPVWCLTRSPR
ncbi:MAG: GNAT family N-acetyltransferase [Actinobacteria bacterium]|nr:GNAT family N-acetyltransferase [Actinomycetota bacterium]